MSVSKMKNAILFILALVLSMGVVYGAIAVIYLGYTRGDLALSLMCALSLIGAGVLAVRTITHE